MLSQLLVDSLPCGATLCCSGKLFPDFNPMDPNPAISACVVFPQSGHIRPEKRPFSRNFPHFSKIEPYKNYEPLIGVQYIVLKPMESSM